MTPLREVDRGAFANPGRTAGRTRSSASTCTSLMADGALEHAAIAQHDERDEVQLGAHDGAEREPRLPGRRSYASVVGWNRRVRRDGRRRQAPSPGRRARDATSAAIDRALAFVAFGQRARRRRPSGQAPARRSETARRGGAGRGGAAAGERSGGRRRASAARARRVPISVPGIVAAKNLRAVSPRDRELRRSDHAHADAVSGAVTGEAERVAGPLQLERRALEVLPAERAADRRRADPDRRSVAASARRARSRRRTPRLVPRGDPHVAQRAA